MENLQTIYSTIRSDILDLKNENSQKIENEFSDILQFTLIFSIEYKSSTITYKDIEACRGEKEVLLEKIFGDDAGKEPTEESKKNTSHYSKIKNKYNLEGYNFYPSIFNFVTKFQKFSAKEFISDFKRAYNIEKGVTLPQYEILDKLSYYNCYDLTDQEYKKLTKDAFEYAKNGLYKAPELATIMHYIERFSNPLELDLDVVQKEILQGLEKSVNTRGLNSPTELMQFKFTGESPDISKWVGAIFSAGNKIIEKSNEILKSETDLEISKSLCDNIEGFLTKYVQDQEFSSLVNFNPFLRTLDISNFGKALSVASGKTIYLLQHFFKERRDKNHFHIAELEAIKNAEKWVENYIKYLNENGFSIRSEMFKILNTNLNNAATFLANISIQGSEEED